MIGSLLYLTASRPDIMFSVCLCACFQEDPKTSHLEAVKRIFQYIKGTTHLGLWYPKGSGIETIVYADSDHAGDYIDRKSTSGVCTFMGCCLTSWFSKKQTALAISTTEAEYVSAEKACQQALWMKQALIDYDVSSHRTGSGDGVDTQSEVPDEQHLKTTSVDEGTGTIPGVPDVPIYESESEKESWVTMEKKIKMTKTILKIKVMSTTEYYEEEEEKIDDEETIDDEEEDKVTKELYEDVNVRLGNEDTEMTVADQGASEQQNVSQESGFEQVEEDAHVILTSVLDTQKADEPLQSSSVSSDFTCKLLNLENPSPADTTPTPTPITSEATTSFTSLPDFSSVFRFNDKVTNLEKDLLEIKKVDQYAQAPSFISAIVDRYIDNKIGEAINKAIQAHNLDYKQQAHDFATPVIEKNVIESLEAAVLAMSSSQPKSTYEAAASLSEFELTKILLEKTEESKSHLRADYKKKLYDALFESYNTEKDLFNS
ncbi:hypothetical protein Tco_0488448 [Tanacetum coccineum]